MITTREFGAARWQARVVSVILIPMHPRETISQFDQFLASRGLRFEATVIGGTALGLLGVSSRQTRDCDVLHPMLPPEIREAAREFAAARRSEGDSLVDDWHVRAVLDDLETRLGDGL